MFLSKFYIFNAREEEKKPSFTLIRKECHQNMLSVPVGTNQKSMSILWGIHPYHVNKNQMLSQVKTNLRLLPTGTDVSIIESHCFGVHCVWQLR